MMREEIANERLTTQGAITSSNAERALRLLNNLTGVVLEVYGER
tara:strand:- start:3028 stop:3159 length:132 start_codon:yes stop_codon:yes gene_type:complete